MLKKWLSSRKKNIVAVESIPTKVSPPPQEDALIILLDEDGNVTSCSGQLSSMLAVVSKPTVLASYLYLPASLLKHPADSWSSQGVDFCFKSKYQQPIYTRGWLNKINTGWQLILADVSDLVIKLNHQDKKIKLFNQLSDMADKIQTKNNTESIINDLLETLSLHLNIPSIAIALKDEEDWFLYQHYSQHGYDAHWWDEYKVQHQLKTNKISEPQIIIINHDENTSKQIWAVPYTQAGEIKSWLLCVYYFPEEKAPFLKKIDWTQLTAQTLAPLLQKIYIGQQHKIINRHLALQKSRNTGWWEYDTKQELIILDPNLCILLNLTINQPLSLAQWLTLLSPADREEFHVRLNEASIGKKSFDLKIRLLINDKYYWYQCYLPASNINNQPNLIGALLDIQDLEYQKQATQAANTRLTSLVDSAPAIIYLLRYENGSLISDFFSDSLHSVLGWTPEQLHSTSIVELVHPDDHDIYFNRTRHLLAEGISSARYRLRDAENNYHWMLDEAKLLRDALGQPQEVIGLYIDITDANIATEKLRHSEERYRVLVEDSPAIICRYQTDLTLTFSNTLFSCYLDIISLESQAINLSNYLSTEQLVAFKKRLKMLTPDNPIADAELCLHIPNKDPLWVVWTERGMFDPEGNLYEVQAVGRDNTEVYTTRLQLYQSAKMATLGEMATTLTHEINQPLNVMRIALVNLLRRIDMNNCEPIYIKNKLSRIEDQIIRVSRIIEHMRNYGRRSTLKQIPFDPHHAIEGALSLTRDTLENSGITINLISAPLPLVLGHIDQLEQVIINLIVNAKDAMIENTPHKNKPLLTIRTYVMENNILLEVEDNGGGISPHQLPKLFDSFFTTKSPGQGTGLGLSVSQSIVQQMGGELGVKNMTQGALFTVSLPIYSDASH